MMLTTRPAVPALSASTVRIEDPHVGICGLAVMYGSPVSTIYCSMRSAVSVGVSLVGVGSSAVGNGDGRDPPPLP